MWSHNGRTSTTRRALSAVSAAALIGLTAACAGGSSSGRAEDGVLTTAMSSYAPTMSTSVPQLMSSMGLDGRNGVRIDYRASGSSSATTLATLMSREVDFAMSSRNVAFDAAAERGDGSLVILASILGRGSTMTLRADVIDRLGLPADASDADKIGALRGLTIGAAPEGSGTNVEFRRILTEYGLDPDRDVQIIGVTDPSALVAGIKQGQFDGGFYAAGVMEANIAAGEAEMWLSVPRGDLAEVTKPGMGGVIVTRRDVVEDNPELAAAVFDAIVATEQQIASDPAGTGAALRADWLPNLDPAVFDLAWKETTLIIPSDGRFTRQHFDSALEDVAGDASRLQYEAMVYERARG